MCLQGGTTAIHRILQVKLNTLTIAKYAKTELLIVYAFVEDKAEQHARKGITYHTMLERV